MKKGAVAGWRPEVNWNLSANLEMNPSGEKWRRPGCNALHLPEVHAIGYRLLREAAQQHRAYGVHTNPKKSAMVTFAAQDKIIVVAES